MTYDPYNQQGQPYGQQPYGQQPYGQPQYGYGYPPPKPQDTSSAVIAFVSSLVGILCCIGWIVGIVMGHIALAKSNRGEATNRGLAIAALCISYGFIVIVVLLYALGIGATLMENANR